MVRKRHNGGVDIKIGNLLPKGMCMSDQELPGAVIRRARKEAGLTQKDLADLSGVSERTVRSIETGTGNPSVAALTAVTRTLGLDVVIR